MIASGVNLGVQSDQLEFNMVEGTWIIMIDDFDWAQASDSIIKGRVLECSHARVLQGSSRDTRGRPRFIRMIKRSQGAVHRFEIS